MSDVIQSLYEDLQALAADNLVSKTTLKAFKRTHSLNTMREQYDFSNAIANPYTKKRKKSAKSS